MLSILVNTLLEHQFEQYVDKVMSEREKYIVMKKNFDVPVLPEFADVFIKSKHISCKSTFITLPF